MRPSINYMRMQFYEILYLKLLRKVALCIWCTGRNSKSAIYIQYKAWFVGGSNFMGL